VPTRLRRVERDPRVKDALKTGRVTGCFVSTDGVDAAKANANVVHPSSSRSWVIASRAKLRRQPASGTSTTSFSTSTTMRRVGSSFTSSRVVDVTRAELHRHEALLGGVVAKMSPKDDATTAQSVVHEGPHGVFARRAGAKACSATRMVAPAYSADSRQRWCRRATR